MRRAVASAGFTLIEVMVALAIVAVTIVLLLDRANDVKRRTGEALNQRRIWPLLSRKMGELEMDPATFQQPSTSGSGDFSEYGAEYRNYSYSYEMAREEVEVLKPDEGTGQPAKPKEICKLTLRVIWTAGREEGEVSLTGHFPVPEAPAAPGATPPGP